MFIVMMFKKDVLGYYNPENCLGVVNTRREAGNLIKKEIKKQQMEIFIIKKDHVKAWKEYKEYLFIRKEVEE